MKRVIRRCVWETNSSMTHACVIMTGEQSNKWEKENVYYYNFGWWNPFGDLPREERPTSGCFYGLDEVLKFLEKKNYHYDPEEYDENVDEFIKECDCGFVSYEMWEESEWEEIDTNTYTTPGGEEIVVYCKYGRDG